MFSKLRRFVSDHPVEAGVGAAAVLAVGVFTYKLLNPPKAFRDAGVHFEEDEYPEQLLQIAKAIHDAGAEEVFFQVEAQALNKNFRLFATPSSEPGSDELVLTHDGFLGLLRSMGISNTSLLERIFREWDKNGNGEINFCEMLQAITLCLKGSSRSKLIAMFHIMDLDGDGFVSRQEMTQFYTNMYSFTNHNKSLAAIKAQVDELFERADKDFSGQLDLNEFLDMGASAKFVVGESLDEHLEVLTRKFAQTLSGEVSTTPSSGPASRK